MINDKFQIYCSRIWYEVNIYGLIFSFSFKANIQDYGLKLRFKTMV
jgi:hypothetical protein